MIPELLNGCLVVRPSKLYVCKGVASALKVGYIFKILGAQSCLMVA